MTQSEYIAATVSYFLPFLIAPIIVGAIFSLVAWLLTKKRSTKKSIIWFVVGFLLAAFVIFYGLSLK